VTTKRKAFHLCTGVALLLVAAGCSGINASHSISPATFLLPGLLKADPPPAPADTTLPEAAKPQQVAQVR
jgi:hypothetical protein